MRKKKRSLLFLAFLIFVFSISLLAGCSTNQSSSMDTSGLAMADLDSMPDAMQIAPLTVQQAYQFAVANPDTLTQIPCYCGCGAMGHTSNYSCYVSGTGAQGKVTYDEHALGCSICVDITQDTMRLLKQNKSVQDIRVYIDKSYSQYGPSNMSGILAPTSNLGGY